MPTNQKSQKYCNVYYFGKTSKNWWIYLYAVKYFFSRELFLAVQCKRPRNSLREDRSSERSILPWILPILGKGFNTILKVIISESDLILTVFLCRASWIRGWNFKQQVVGSRSEHSRSLSIVLVSCIRKIYSNQNTEFRPYFSRSHPRYRYP